MPEGNAPGCTVTKALDGTTSTGQAVAVEDSRQADDAKPVDESKSADAVKPEKPIKSKYARSHLRRSWFGKADLLTMFGR